ncbi:LysR family transcriptional regulator [Shimia thalassica]|uniref:LysR family transcriptional regulator n=1 Tax=Shimia thalassica TaxID=1715693 RepID=UPI0027325504|nr:LysR family transcriptional regulator [Shimia thalassica]MDP2518944.1 LysR family transcriptional regulator [Shimia thalassica]
MDTDSLRLFVLAAEKLNISAAGRALGLAPAVSSARLAKLEQTLGADLLHRSTRKVSLSLEGAEFLPYAREMLAQEEAGRAALGQGQATPTGKLRFTAPSTFAQLYIAPILPLFLKAYAGITLDLRLSDSRFDLIEGSFDLAIRNSALEDTSLKGRKLASDRRILCASPAYLAEHGTPARPEDLIDHNLISFADQETRPLAGPNGQTGAFSPRDAQGQLIIDDGLSQKIATIAGAGISINSIWSVHQELRNGQLVRVLPAYQVAEETVLWLVYPKANVLSAKVRVFIDFLLDQIGKNPAWEQE